MIKSSKAANPPSHRLYHVEGTGESATWTKIGAAWPNKDGQGFSLRCEGDPAPGRIVMRGIGKRPANRQPA